MEKTKKLDPGRQNRIQEKPDNSKRTYVRITNNPETISPGACLRVVFPNLEKDDIVAPGSAKISFRLNVSGGLPRNNICRTILKSIRITICGKELFQLHRPDLFYTYVDSWRSNHKKVEDCYERGLWGTGLTSENCLKHRLGHDSKVTNSSDELLAAIYSNTFVVPLDFEFLTTVSPFYQHGLQNRLIYELTFADVDQFIIPDDDDTSTSYTVTDIKLEYEKITSPSLSNHIQQVYSNYYVLYDRILLEKIYSVNSNDTRWNWNITVPARSLRGVLFIGYDDNGKVWNFGIDNVNVQLEGVNSQIYSEGIKGKDMYKEASRFFSGSYKSDRSTDHMTKELHLTSINQHEFYVNNYCVWLDFRTADDNSLHGNGRPVNSQTNGVQVQMTRKSDGKNKSMKIYTYMVMDAYMQLTNDDVEVSY